MINVLKDFAWFLSVILTLYTGYFYLISLFSFLPRKKQTNSAPRHRFSILIAARNEESVIGNLVDSLKQQDYPPELFDITVIPNNCTDGTREAALAHGAGVFDCRRSIKSKGEALEEYFDREGITGRYDAFCIFDADNIVDPGYLRAMNSALAAGSRIAQGYRESKNPGDSFVSAAYSVYYYMVNRFFNRARNRLGLSAMVNGSGFMVKADLLEKMGGWHTKTMTEDIEFTTQCVLKGEKVDWVPEAVFYDEQPLTFAQSWHQRKRWSTGLIQGMQLYALPHFRRMLKGKAGSADMLQFYIAPVMQILFSLLFLLDLVLNLLYIRHDYFPETQIFNRMFLSLFWSYVLSTATAALVVILEKKRKVLGGVFFYWLFIISWIPINIISLFRKQTVWTPIAHTRSLGMDQILGNSRLPKKRSA